MASLFASMAGMVQEDGGAAEPPAAKKPRTDTHSVRCQHNLVAKDFTVSKDGPNKGRVFFKCPKNDKNEQCKFYAWADELAAGGGGGGAAPAAAVKCKQHGIPAVAREVKKEGANKGRMFYKCGKPEQADQCDFFEWVDAAAAAPSAAAPAAAPRASYSAATRPSAAAIPPLDARKTRMLQALKLMVTPEEAARIRDLPQRSDEWKQARGKRLTASNFGTAAGHNEHTTPDAFLLQLLWPELEQYRFEGNQCTRWGTFFETLACSEYTVFRQREWRDMHMAQLRRGELLPHGVTEMSEVLRVEHSGLIVNPAAPWLGVSPDGLVHAKDPDTGEDVCGLLEIKAPWSMTIYETQDKYATSKYKGIPAGIPPYYYDQIIGVMALAGLPWADFCVWTPSALSVRRYVFDEAYWLGTLLPKLEAFYFERYVPALQLKEAGKLRPGELSPTLVV